MLAQTKPPAANSIKAQIPMMTGLLLFLGSTTGVFEATTGSRCSDSCSSAKAESKPVLSATINGGTVETSENMSDFGSTTVDSATSSVVFKSSTGVSSSSIG